MIAPLIKSKEKLDGNRNDSFCKYEGKTSIGKMTPEKAIHPIKKIELTKEALLKIITIEVTTKPMPINGNIDKSKMLNIWKRFKNVNEFGSKTIANIKINNNLKKPCDIGNADEARIIIMGFVLLIKNDSK